MLAQRNRTSPRAFQPKDFAPQVESLPPAETAPRAVALPDLKQRRLMAVALFLLIVALAGLLYRDRDFWFPETPVEEVDADQPAEKISAPSATAAQAPPAATPATPSNTKPKVSTHPATKSVAPVKANKSAKASATAKASTPAHKAAVKNPATLAAKQPAAVNNPPALATKQPSAVTQPAAPAVKPAAPLVAQPPAPAPPIVATNRTVLPPLEVEVVAGDNHSTVRPGSNSVHVDLKPGSPPQPAAAPSAGATPETVINTPTSAVERVQMSADTASAVTHSVKPGYPLLARQMKVQGSVILQALISKDGVIQDLHVLSGPQILASAAQDAVRQWHFKPHYIGSEAVETQAKITVNFTISTN